MSLNLGNLEATLSLNTKGFRRNLNEATTEVSKKTKDTTMGFGSAKIAAVALTGSIAALAVGFGKLSTALAQTHVEMESVERMMLFASKTTAQANKDWATLKQMSNSLGVNFNDLVKTYSRLRAAAEGTNISNEDIMVTLRGVSQAALAMGLDGETLSRVLQGVQQIASRGVVSMEELRGQIGEQLPNAMGAMSRALNLSVKQLSDFVATGNLTSEAVVLMGAQLQKETAATAKAAENSMSAMTARMKTAWSDLKRTFLTGEIGASVGAQMSSIGGMIQMFTNILIKLQPLAVLLKNEFNKWGVAFKDAMVWLEPLGKFLGGVFLTAIILISDHLRGWLNLITKMVHGVTSLVQGIGNLAKKIHGFLMKGPDEDIMDIMMAGEGLPASMRKRDKKKKKTPAATAAVQEARETMKAVVTEVKAAEEVSVASTEAIFTKYADFIKDVGEQATKSTKEVNEMAEGIMGATSSALSTFFDDVVHDFDSAFGNLFENLINEIYNVVIELMVIKPLMESIFGGSKGGSGLWQGIVGGIGKAFGFAEGGIIKEPVIGMGLKSGAGYAIAEKGPEVVAPIIPSMGIENQQGKNSQMNQYNVTIQALDSQSASEYMRRNPGAILGPITSAIQHGNKGLMGALRTAM